MAPEARPEERPATEQPPDTPEQLPPSGPDAASVRRRTADLSRRNDNTERALRDDNGSDRQRSPEQRDINKFKEVIQPALDEAFQEQLGFNTYTNFENVRLPQLRQFYDRMQEVKLVTRNMANERNAQVIWRFIQEAHPEYRDREINQQSAEAIQKIIDDLVDATETHITDAMKGKDLEPGEPPREPAREREQRIQRGETLELPPWMPTDAALTPASKAVMRKFVDSSVYAKLTADGPSYIDMLRNNDIPEDKRELVKTFNTLMLKWKDAMTHVAESSATPAQKNERAGKLERYADAVLKPPVNPDTIPSFKDWLRANPA